MASEVNVSLEEKANEATANEEEEEGIFPRAGERRPTLVKDMQRRRRNSSTRPRSNTIVEADAQDEHGLNLLWTGKIDDARTLYGTKQNGSYLRKIRAAQCDLFCYFLQHDKVTKNDVILRLIDAENTCLEEAFKLRQPYRDKGLQRIRRSLSFSWKKEKPVVDREAEAEDRKELERKYAEWKKLQGWGVFCAVCIGCIYYVNGSTLHATMAFRRAWTHAKAFHQSGETGEEEKDKHDICEFIQVAFQFGLGFLPYWMAGLIRLSTQTLVPSPTLETRLFHMARLHAPTHEVGNYARLVLVLYWIMLSTQEYRSDRSALLKQANEQVEQVLEKHPDWILFRWAQTHILRRLGRLEDAHELSSLVCTDLQNQIRRISSRLRMDMATLKFVNREWKACEFILRPLLAAGNELVVFPQRVHAMVMLAACCGMRHDIRESVYWLELVEQKLVGQVSSNDKSWHRKASTLCHRPNKRVLAYEFYYLFGYFKWFDCEIAGTLRVGGRIQSQNWLERTRDDLNILYGQAEISLMHPEPPHVTHHDAVEELLVVSLMRGVVYVTYGKLDDAQKAFTHVLENASTWTARDGTKTDPWHAPFAMYELGVMELRRGMNALAKSWLTKALNQCHRKRFSFRDRLAVNCRYALKYVDDQESSVSGTHVQTDELGTYLGTGEGEDTLDLSAMETVTIPRKEQFVMKKALRCNEIVSWQWVIHEQDVKFNVSFVPQERHVLFEDDLATVQVDPNKEIHIRDVEHFEPGDRVTGFYLTKEEGIIKFCWDNTYALYADKTIQYAIHTRGAI